MKQIALVIVVSVAITLMIPRRGTVSISADNGQIWTEESIIAPFDIPVSKSIKEIEAERVRVRHNLRPVFDLDTNITYTKLTQMRQGLVAAQVAENICDSAISIARRIFGRGVISSSEANSYAGGAIMVTDAANRLWPLHTTSVHTPATALETVSRLSGLPQEQLQNYFIANLTYNEVLSAALRNDAIDEISTTRGVIRAGEVVVAKGQLVDDPTRLKISSLSSIYESRLSEGSAWYNVFFGRFIIVFIIISLNALFFMKFSVHYFGQGIKELIFVMMLYLIFAGLISLTSSLGLLSSFIVPLPAVAIYLLTFFNMRVAILGNLTMALIGAMFVRMPFDFFAINLLGGMTAIFMMRHFYHRGKLMRAIGTIFVVQVLLYICFGLMRQGSFAAINYASIFWFLVSAFLTMGFYQAIYLLERLFGFVSDITLLEMCDTNQPLLMQLAQNAPGTFQHSVQVANLAESAAKDIGANPLLARTGALYHDIGKMENPFYFVENTTGTFNPHDDCTPTQSAQIVKNHIAEGVAVAKKYKLPQGVIEFIETHHGTSLIYYFWSLERDARGGKAVQSDFRYDGPKPVGREVSICMMADAVEAASRSLPSYDKEPLEALVESVIDTQIADGQFAGSALSFQEIARIKELFKVKLNNIYHGRIAYPARK